MTTSLKGIFDEVHDTDGLLGTNKSPRYTTNTSKVFRTKQFGYFLLGLNLVWSLANLSITSQQARSSLSLNRDMRLLSVPSPLFDLMDLGPLVKTVSGSIHTDGSIFRRSPSAEVDAAWSRIALDGYEMINVTRADILASGKDPAIAARWDPAVDAYPAQIEFSHKIHCLNVVRQEIWGDHYFGNESIRAHETAIARGDYDPEDGRDLFIDGDSNKRTLKARRLMHQQHTMHCLHIILQDLMCNVDVGIITHNWASEDHSKGMPAHPVPDFSTKKQCRDFDAATGWIKSHAVQHATKKFAKLERPPGAPVWNTSDSYWPSHGH